MIEFWYDFASTYSYLAAFAIEAKAETAGLRVVWRPFLLGPLFAAQGWTDSPFNLYPAKGAYMWHDMARECARLDLPWQPPSVFPRRSQEAARVALAVPPDRIAPFSKAVFAAAFAQDQDIADQSVLAALLENLGLPAAAVLARAASPDIKQLLRTQTEQARALGLFGAPSFMRGGELFWGNERIDLATLQPGR
jgi:2-hydroxychromene-2-carboxylate isomerase